MPVIVRWMGAFARRASLEDSLRWELSQSSQEVAAEPLSYGKSGIRWCGVGLMVAPWAVVRTFRGDVHSEVGSYGALSAAIKPSDSEHKEAFCRPVFTAIVVNCRVSREAWITVKKIGREFNLPIKTIQPKRRKKHKQTGW